MPVQVDLRSIRRQNGRYGWRGGEWESSVKRLGSPIRQDGRQGAAQRWVLLADILHLAAQPLNIPGTALQQAQRLVTLLRQVLLPLWGVFAQLLYLFAYLLEIERHLFTTVYAAQNICLEYFTIDFRNGK
jgi:hypothetical protein